MTLPFAALALLIVSSSGQDSVRIQKVFKEGDSERVTAKLSMAVADGDIDMQLSTQQRVLKVFANGDADLESKVLSLEVRINGELAEVGAKPQDSKTVMRVNRMGIPVQAGKATGFGFNFLHFIGLVGDVPLQKGKRTPVTWSDPYEPKRKSQGTITLDNLEDGIARLISSWEIAMPEQPKPLKIDMVSFVEVATGRVQRASGTITGAPSQGLEIKAVQFSMETTK